MFGDSYADPKPRRISWCHYLEQLIPNSIVESFGISGTSHWWSYQNFLEHYSDYDIIIFIHTNPIRWPSVPDNIAASAWDVWGNNVQQSDPFIQKINPFFHDVFPEKLLNFISSSIFKNVNEFCLDTNKFLINIFGFQMYPDIKQISYYPILHEMVKISFMEKTKFKDKEYNVMEFLSEYKMMDPRSGHLSSRNNQNLAKIIFSLIDQRPIDFILDLSKAVGWSEYDEYNIEEYRNII